MSETNQDLQREGLNELNGKLYYRDKFGNWYQKADGYSGYESLFLSDVIDPTFRAEVMNSIQASSEAKISLQYENRWHTIWQDMDDGMRSSINRKVIRDKVDGENTFDSTQQTKEQAQNPPAQRQQQPQQNKFSGNYNSDGKSKYFVDEIKLKIMTAEEFQSGLKFESMWNIAEKASENIKIVQDSHGDVFYHIILQHKKAF